MAKVCIDQGHAGQYNRSPVVPAYYESVIMWQLGILLEAELKKRGIEVVMTRKELQRDPSLSERGKASKGCDLFLSLHSDACDDESVDRPTAFALVDDDTTKVDDVSQEIALELVKAVRKSMGITTTALVKTRKSGNDRNGDGLLNDNYYGVLHAARQVGTPAVLMEHSFHTNTRSAQWLLKLANLEKLAIAEADVIATYFGVERPASPSSVRLYRVQVGAFKDRNNTTTMQAQIKTAGFDAFITSYSGYYRVQIGAFQEKTNAEALLAKIKAAGFKAFVTDCDAPAADASKSVDEVAKEVLTGKWGNGEERKKKLTAAGYDVTAVQKRVNELMK